MGAINTIANWYKIMKIIQSGERNIKDIQRQRLRRLLHHAVSKSEFYQDLYKGIDIENCRLEDLPVVTKAAMMDNQLYLGEFYPFMTSGSTGVNALIVYHRRAVDVIQARQFLLYPFLPKRSKHGPVGPGVTCRPAEHLF